MQNKSLSPKSVHQILIFTPRLHDCKVLRTIVKIYRMRESIEIEYYGKSRISKLNIKDKRTMMLIIDDDTRKYVKNILR